MSKEQEVRVPLRGQADPEGRLTGCLAFTSIVATLASFQFGYHIGCVNAPGTLIQTWFQKSHKDLFDSHLNEDNAKLAWSVAVSMFAVGGMIGGLSVGWLADKFGRRGAMMYNNLLALAAAALMGLAKSVNVYPMIIIGRLIIGLNAGISSGLVPMYLTEVSPINLRGTLGSLPQLLVTIAILVSQIYGHPSLLGDDQKWPLIFAFTIVPAVLQLVLLAFCPESPKYLISVRGQPEKATASLKKLRGTDDVTDEINLMLEEAAAQQQAEKVSIGAMFKANLRWPITIAIIMMFAQQFSGINVVMFYSTFIFTQAGLTGDEPFYATIGVGVVNVLMTVVSVYIVEKFGRRPLMLTGLVGMFITTASLVGALSGIYAYENEKWISYVAIVIVFAFVIAFATGPGSIPWFFVSEIFDSSARGSANSIAVMTNWLANLLVSLSFLPLNNLLKQYTFLMFTTLLGVFIFFTAKFVPETKGRTLEQIQAAMKH